MAMLLSNVTGSLVNQIHSCRRLNLGPGIKLPAFLIKFYPSQLSFLSTSWTCSVD